MTLLTSSSNPLPPGAPREPQTMFPNFLEAFWWALPRALAPLALGLVGSCSLYFHLSTHTRATATPRNADTWDIFSIIETLRPTPKH